MISKRLQSITPSSTLEITGRAKELKSQGIDVISFATGEPDFDTPQHIKNEAKKAIDEGFTKYTPVNGIIELKKAIQNKFKNDNKIEYGLDQILVSNGAKQSIYNLIQTLIDPGDEVLITIPYWVSYPEMIRLAEGVPIFIKTDDGKINIEYLEKSITNKTKLLIINSPSNPDGNVYSIHDLELIADFCVRNDFYVISDEVYEKLIFDVDHISIASLNKDIYERTFTVNGVSKAFSMTGWRIGYCAGNTEIINSANTLQSHSTSGPNSIAQRASVVALNEPFDFKPIVDEFKKRRDYFLDELSSINGITCKIPQGAFYLWIDISKLFNTNTPGSFTWCEKLLSDKFVAIVPGGPFGDDTKIRISFATSMEQIRRGMVRIKEFILDNNKV